MEVMRRTCTENAGIPDTSVTISMKDSDHSIEGDGNYDENSTSGQDEESTKKQTPARKKKKQKKALLNPISRRGRTRIEKPRAIIDPGTEVDVIGSVGWKVLSKVDNQVAQLDGALEGMGECSLLLVTAVTAHDHPTEGTVLLGAGCAGWDERPEQTKSLFNSHDMRKHNVIVHDTAKRDGGLQRLEVDGVHIALNFVDDKTLSFQLRQPTQEELENLEILWLTPRKLTANSKIHRTARRAPGGIVPVPAPWEERLGYAPELITVKTLKATAQLWSSPVEMDRRENPRQHCKTRIQALHPRRITGRTDLDTFFSSVESVRKFMSVQIFFCVLTKFLYVKGMRRKSHSYGAYQDFVQDVGAPNMLLTDNSQTQTGKKWTKTSQENITKQVQSAPHDQNQNQAERKIRDVKNRTILTFRYSSAPLLFWCYCMTLVVDCLNHTAQKDLECRTAMEKMYGNTPDISMFRFRFWEPVWYYYKPTAKYPAANILQGRFVGIAWDCGDSFTYKIWTTPNDVWEDGCELIRNIVRSRSKEQDEPWAEYKNEDLEFTRTKLTRGQKNKEERAKKRKRRSEDETEEDQQDPRRAVRFDVSHQARTTEPEEMGGGNTEPTSSQSTNHCCQRTTSIKPKSLNKFNGCDSGNKPYYQCNENSRGGGRNQPRRL
jgi:hypothetical protein